MTDRAGTLKRLWRHLVADYWSLHHAFPADALARIEQVIGEQEKRHGGEIRFAVEGGMDVMSLIAGKTPRERAIELFGALRVWDTEENCGVLVYVSLGDRDVEILADRGIERLVGDEPWQAVVDGMRGHFREGRFEQGATEGIRAIGDILAKHFPRRDGRPNELPDRPLVL